MRIARLMIIMQPSYDHLVVLDSTLQHEFFNARRMNYMMWFSIQPCSGIITIFLLNAILLNVLLTNAGDYCYCHYYYDHYKCHLIE